MAFFKGENFLFKTLIQFLVQKNLSRKRDSQVVILTPNLSPILEFGNDFTLEQFQSRIYQKDRTIELFHLGNIVTSLSPPHFCPADSREDCRQRAGGPDSFFLLFAHMLKRAAGWHEDARTLPLLLCFRTLHILVLCLLLGLKY